METKPFYVSLEKNPVISVKVIPGHFTTSNSHISHYLDMGTMKTNATVAREVARELAIPYRTTMFVETIVCMEKTEVIGAYLAEELTRYGTSVVNSEHDINVVTPINSINGKLVFQDSMIELISNRSVVLLIASISSGRTIEKAVECLTYYGGKLVSISSLFSAAPEARKIHSMFTSKDIPGYKTFFPTECEMCKAGQKLNALVSSEGYMEIK